MRAGQTGNQEYSRTVMALRIELWGPPLAPLTGGNLYDRILVETLRNRGHEITVRKFVGDGSETPAASARADVIVQDGLLHREFRRRNAAWTGRRPRLVALVHHPQSSEPERGETELARLRGEERAYLRTVDAVLSPSRASVEAARRLAGRKLPAAVAPPRPGPARGSRASPPAPPGRHPGAGQRPAADRPRRQRDSAEATAGTARSARHRPRMDPGGGGARRPRPGLRRRGAPARRRSGPGGPGSLPGTTGTGGTRRIAARERPARRSLDTRRVRDRLSRGVRLRPARARRRLRWRGRNRERRRNRLVDPRAPSRGVRRGGLPPA